MTKLVFQLDVQCLLKILLISLGLSVASQVNVTNIRLADGPSMFEGRVEVQVDGNETWGTICDWSFSGADARVICKMLLGRLTYVKYFGNARYGEGTGPFFIQRLNCVGNESHINSCRHSMNSWCNDHDVVSVKCSVAEISETKIRLADGSSRFDGRVELFIDGEWGTVSRHISAFFTERDAVVACRMLGIVTSKPVTFGSYRYKQGSGPVLLYGTYCNGNEQSLLECNYDYENSSSIYRNDAGILCSECGLDGLSDLHGPYYNLSENGLIMTALCSDGSDKFNITYHCSNGKWEPVGRPCGPFLIGETRLVGGEDQFYGVVEVNVNGIWGTMCYTSNNEMAPNYAFGHREAWTLCSTLGLRGEKVMPKRLLPLKIFSKPIINRFDCPNEESNISRCSFSVIAPCNGNEAAIICDGRIIKDVRVRNVSSTSKDIAEIRISGQWKGVCNSRFGDKEANVFCRTLGKSLMSFQIVEVDDNLPMTIRVLECTGKEDNLNDCKFESYSSYCLKSREGVSIACSGCPSLQTEGSVLNTTMTTFGTVVHFQCKEGYRQNGKSIIECLQNDSWSDQPSCSLKSCPPLQNEGSILNTTLTEFGTIVHFQCKEGYRQEGKSVVECLKSHTWSDNPVCILKEGDVSLLTVAVGGSACFLVVILVAIVCFIRRQVCCKREARSSNQEEEANDDLVPQDKYQGLDRTQTADPTYTELVRPNTEELDDTVVHAYIEMGGITGNQSETHSNDIPTTSNDMAIEDSTDDNYLHVTESSEYISAD